VKLLNGAVGDSKQTLAVGGKADRPIAAVDELNAERLIERDDLAAPADGVRKRSCAASVMLMRRPTATKPRRRSRTATELESFACDYVMRTRRPLSRARR
jgi:hypothetical protein